MPPRLSLRSVAGRSRSLRDAVAAPRPSVCLFCSLAPSPANGSSRATKRRPTTTTPPAPATTRRSQSTVTPSAPTTVRPSNPRAELVHALRDLQTHASQYVNLSRLQLALDSLAQPAGDETIRVAVYGSSATVNEVLRLLLADPLSAEQEWEEQLLGHDLQAPLVIRVGADRHHHTGGSQETRLRFSQDEELKELHVSAPGLNQHRLEILLLSDDQLTGISREGKNAETAVLVPEVNLSPSTTSNTAPVISPVHKALLIKDGVGGIASLAHILSSPSHEIFAAAHLPGYASEKDVDSFPLPIDVKPAKEGVAAFRQSLDKAFEYEKLWFKSRLPALLSWLKEGSAYTDDGATKATVRSLVASILQSTNRTIEGAEERLVRSSVNSLPPPGRIASLNKELAAWSEKAHAELQGELDNAFTSRRWKKLNWWKLFWRVDDVGMLSSEMLSQRFLPRAERNVIYLAGQVEGSGVWYPENCKAVYSIPAPLQVLGETKTSTNVSSPPPASAISRGTRWPTHITFTRNYLQSETIPALQALAQKLVIQSAGFSTLTSSLGALMYLSSFGISESGAVAAFGIVWSLRRLQKKWETAREYWQSEVREEGRKAVRAVEISVGEAIDKAVQRRSNWQQDGSSFSGELGEARKLVQKAEDALKKL